MPVRIRFAKSKLSHEARPLAAYRTMANVAMSPMSRDCGVLGLRGLSSDIHYTLGIRAGIWAFRRNGVSQTRRQVIEGIKTNFRTARFTVGVPAAVVGLSLIHI